MHTRMTRRDWAILIIFCVAAPILFSTITTHWRGVFGHLLTADMSIPLNNAFVVMAEVVGIGAAAIILAIPLAWLIRHRPFFLALCLTLAAAIGTLLPNLLMDLSVSNFTVSKSMVVPLLIFFALCWAATALVNAFVRAKETVAP